MNANHGQIFKMFEKEVKSKHKSPLQKLPAKKEPTMNASAISKLLFGSIDPYKKDNVHQKQFVEIWVY